MTYDAFMMDVFLPGSAVVTIAAVLIIWRLAARSPRGLLPTALIAVAAIVLPVALGALYVLGSVLLRGGGLAPDLAAFAFEGGIELSVIAIPAAIIALIIARIKSRKTVEA